MSARLEPITGRYAHIELDGRAHRLYYEEAGSGIPLLCLHTAGSDGRQYRAVLNDATILKHYRVIAFDMPWHGKSSPPAPGWHDLFALLRRGEVKFEGDQRMLWAYLLYLKLMLAALRP